MTWHPIFSRFCAILMLILARDAQAGWEQVGADDRLYLFADRQTLLKEGATVRMRHLVDYKLRPPENGLPYQSSTVEVEYDCSRNRFRELSATFHPYRMGEGQSGMPAAAGGDWQAIPRGSGAEILGNIACGREKNKAEKKEKIQDPGMLAPYRQRRVFR